MKKRLNSFETASPLQEIPFPEKIPSFYGKLPDLKESSLKIDEKLRKLEKKGSVTKILKCTKTKNKAE